MAWPFSVCPASGSILIPQTSPCCFFICWNGKVISVRSCRPKASSSFLTSSVFTRPLMCSSCWLCTPKCSANSAGASNLRSLTEALLGAGASAAAVVFSLATVHLCGQVYSNGDCWAVSTDRQLAGAHHPEETPWGDELVAGRRSEARGARRQAHHSQPDAEEAAANARDGRIWRRHQPQA